VYDKPGIRPIRALLLDPEITEIMINGPRHLFVEKHGVMQPIPPVFGNREQVQLLVETLLANTGRAVNARHPMVDFRLPDGSRVNVVIPPIALDGPVVTIRKFTRSLRTLEDLIARGALDGKMATVLEAAIRARLNIVFSGGAGSGKTTLLGLLAASIPEGERIVVIEDTAELELPQRHVVRMECRPPNMEGAGGISMSDLLRNSLRMRPSRIIVGEIRSDEAWEMLHAMSSGHDGCLAVVHASSPSHAISRLEMMVLARGVPLPPWAIHRQLANAIDLVVQLAMLGDGRRRVTHITEVAGVHEGEVAVRDLFRFEIEGVDSLGRIQGRHRPTGVKPRFLDRLVRATDPSIVHAFEPEASDHPTADPSRRET
jgi:pilus assembly protein CpaF